MFIIDSDAIAYMRQLINKQILEATAKTALAKAKIEELLILLEEHGGSVFPLEIMGHLNLCTPDTWTLINHAISLRVVVTLEDGRIACQDYGSDAWLERIMYFKSS